MGDDVREIRQKRKITGETLSELLNISSSYLSKIESNKKPLSLEIALQVCIKLNDFNLYAKWKSQLELYIAKILTQRVS